MVEKLSLPNFHWTIIIRGSLMKSFRKKADPQEIRTTFRHRKNSGFATRERNYSGGIECRVWHRSSITTVGKFASRITKGGKKGRGKERSFSSLISYAFALSFWCFDKIRLATFSFAQCYLYRFRNVGRRWLMMKFFCDQINRITMKWN